MDSEGISNVLIWHKPSADISHNLPKPRPIHQSRDQTHSHTSALTLELPPQPPLEFAACALCVCVCLSLVSYLHAINKGRHRQGWSQRSALTAEDTPALSPSEMRIQVQSGLTCCISLLNPCSSSTAPALVHPQLVVYRFIQLLICWLWSVLDPSSHNSSIKATKFTCCHFLRFRMSFIPKYKKCSKKLKKMLLLLLGEMGEYSVDVAVFWGFSEDYKEAPAQWRVLAAILETCILPAHFLSTLIILSHWEKNKTMDK